MAAIITPMAFSTTCPPDPDDRNPGSDMALSALKCLALNTNPGAGSIGPGGRAAYAHAAYVTYA